MVSGLVLAAAALVGGCGGGDGGSKDEATVSACQRAQGVFIATPANKPQLIATRLEAVKDACGAGSARVEQDTGMLGLEAEVDRQAPDAMGMAEQRARGR